MFTIVNKEDYAVPVDSSATGQFCVNALLQLVFVHMQSHSTLQSVAISFFLTFACCCTSIAFVAGTPFKADRDLWLSPEARLLADSPGLEDFVYDGQGKRLVLPQDISVDEPLPLILIGPGRTLQLKNLKLVHAASLPACLQLGPGMHTCNKAQTYVCVLLSAITVTSGKAAFIIVMHCS